MVSPDADPPASPAGSAVDRATPADRAIAVQSFYGRWARVYDVVARRTPGVGGLRQGAVERLALEPGDVVLDVGCGTGANLPYLRSAVGRDGRVIGVDLTPGMLAAARDRRERTGWDTVDLVLADGADPPVGPGSVDAVLGTFVTGMFAEPAAAVDRWLDCLAPGGRACLVDLVPSRRAIARPLNLAFAGLTAISTPPTTKLRYERSLPSILAERVAAGRDPVAERLDAVEDDTAALGYLRVTSGRLPLE